MAAFEVKQSAAMKKLPLRLLILAALALPTAAVAQRADPVYIEDRLNQLQQSISLLTGQIEQLQYRNNQLQQQLEKMQAELGVAPPSSDGGEHYDMVRLDWFDLRNMLLVAQTVVRAAIERRESRGAHQREDFPGMLPEWQVNQIFSYQDGRLGLSRSQPAKAAQ